ncbi:MAG TPA: hypothetical protein H9717_04810 [Candidatus Eisenbergiella merdipullorum]|uniref:Uncharacterized protein n=1 Tax=Candidatus Eisenbergiella merdipullorum TaxID=2838553 RepID=A0A9D2I5W3_9FIRM|nr:hypothetical protein [Candidatus Eisenbergiella merdipullorum]
MKNDKGREVLMRKKKRRRRKRLLILFFVLICLLAAGVPLFLFRQRSMNAAREAVQISAGENEEITYARISMIVGNEIEVSILNRDPSEQAGAAYTETGETGSWQIPVGTDVITSLGVTTTFSRLSAGDVIAVLTEAGTDNILKIWIVQ